VAAKARRGLREDHTLVGTWNEPSVVAPRLETVVEVTEPEVELAPEPEVELAPEPEVELAPEPEVELAPEPVVEIAWAQPWEVRAKARVERLIETTLRHRRALITVCAVALAVILLVAVPAIVRTRHNSRWERCVQRTTGTTLPRGGHLTQVVLDDCGPRPTFNRVPADRRN
jgi:hypothetical protein